MRSLATGAIRIYQIVLSPYLPGACRHIPTCSRYASEAISRYGVIKGAWLGIRRLGRCRPMGTSGYDPVPYGRLADRAVESRSPEYNSPSGLKGGARST